MPTTGGHIAGPPDTLSGRQTRSAVFPPAADSAPSRTRGPSEPVWSLRRRRTVAKAARGNPNASPRRPAAVQVSFAEFRRSRSRRCMRYPIVSAVEAFRTSSASTLVMGTQLLPACSLFTRGFNRLQRSNRGRKIFSPKPRREGWFMVLIANLTCFFRTTLEYFRYG